MGPNSSPFVYKIGGRHRERKKNKSRAVVWKDRPQQGVAVVVLGGVGSWSF